MKRSKFFTDLAARKGTIGALQASYTEKYLRMGQFLREFNVEYLPTREGLFLHFERSGKMYKMEDRGDSLLYFVRQDKTINYNYNNGSFLFYSAGNIYELGGYGFWKSNGLLRLFNTKDREWDIVPANREFHVPVVSIWRSVAWVDSGERYLYAPYEQVVNDGIISSNNSTFTNGQDCYRLDIKNRRWENMGVSTDHALEIMRLSNWASFPSERGLLFGFPKGIYLFDFESNQIFYHANPGLVQSTMRLQSTNLCYFYKGWIYAFNPFSYQYDSLQYDMTQFMPTGKPIWEKPFPYTEVGVGLAVLLGLGGFWMHRTFKRKPIPTSPPPVGIETPPRPFTEVEQALLNLLLSRSENGRTANISEINYVLGLKEKSPGMQKKVRSDVMNSLNEKFAFVTHRREPLVQSIRSETDKRYFEYLIHPESRADLKRMLS